MGGLVNSIEQRVVVVDIRMKFWSMVVFMVKLAIASIPAALILFAMALLFAGLWTGLLRAIGH